MSKKFCKKARNYMPNELDRVFEPSSYHILIVEDSKSLNNVLYNHFKNLSYECTGVETLQEAYNILENTKIDYIMLDINLPDGLGYELIKKYEHSQTKIFVLTSEKDEQLRELSFQKGVIDYLIKDKNFFYRLDELTSIIEKIEKNQNSTILVVDDSIIIQRQLEEIFTNRKYQVKVTSEAEDILKIVETTPIDLILLDINLQENNGIEFLKKHKSLIIDKKQIPVMMISGHIEGATIRDSLKAGAIDVIRKPYVIEEMILKIDSAIDYKRKQKEYNSSESILKQYKNALNKGYIVSKSDTNGIITYINDAYCELSQFSKEELISNSIIKHKEMSDEVFKELWYTIKELKKVWTGKIKGRKKDNSIYWLNTTVIPILDKKGNIIEFVCIGHEVTSQMS